MTLGSVGSILLAIAVFLQPLPVQGSCDVAPSGGDPVVQAAGGGEGCCRPRTSWPADEPAGGDPADSERQPCDCTNCGCQTSVRPLTINGSGGCLLDQPMGSGVLTDPAEGCPNHALPILDPPPEPVHRL